MSAGKVLADDWEFSGDVGGEIESIGESFGTSTLFDTRYDPTETPEEALEAVRFRDQTTRANALLRGHLLFSGSNYFDLHGTLRAAPSRTRGDAETETGIRRRAFDAWIGDRIHAQGGEDDPGGGFLNVARAGVRLKSLPGPLSMRLAFDHEYSRAGADSLARLFDYTSVRPRSEIRYDLGWRGDLSLEGGLTAKRAERGSSSYDRPWLEMGFRYAFPHDRTIDLAVRTETRRYLESDSLRPTLHEEELRGRWTIPFSTRWRTEWILGLHDLQYAMGSSVFRDHASGEIEGLVSFDIGGSGTAEKSEVEDRSGGDEALGSLADSLLMGLQLDDPMSAGDLDLDEFLRPKLWFGWGLRAEALQNEDSRRGDYDELAGVVTLARDATSGTWFDLRAEAGRRDYRGSGARGDLIFEGLDLSLTGTDYRFISTTALLEVPAPFSLSVSGFGQYDREWHDVRADDFELWLLTLSLTRKF